MLRMQSRVVASATRLITVPARFATSKKPLSLYLLKDVPGVGSFGEKVEVKHGFGRNYLIPQGFALYATPENREVMYVKHNVDPEASAAAADAEAEEASAAESARVAHRPYFEAGARTISNLNWRFRRQLLNPKGDSLEVRNPITKRDILSMLREANIHHASLDDIVFPPGVESLNTFGAYTFAIRYTGVDASDWVTVVAGIFPPLDATIEVTKSLLKKERADIVEERERRYAERRDHAKHMELRRRRRQSEDQESSN